MVRIDEALAARLVARQFPDWAGLPVRAVEPGGWDHRSFRLGEDKVLRLPSAIDYVPQVAREQRWLPYLAGRLGMAIPTPLARGEPGDGYPWPWSVCEWVEGHTPDRAEVAGSVAFATDVAAFLRALQRIDATGGPPPSEENFHRGGALSVYDGEVRAALGLLQGRIDAPAALELWERALATRWGRGPVWVHGDVGVGNLLAEGGRLVGVIDFGSMAVGDPACDLAIAWTTFEGRARQAFIAKADLDKAAWLRARAWALWKALILASDLGRTNALEWQDPLDVVQRVLAQRPEGMTGLARIRTVNAPNIWGREPDGYEKGVRFGCGFVFGVAVVIVGTTTYSLLNGYFLVAVLAVGVGTGLLAMRLGDKFWESALRWFQ